MDEDDTNSTWTHVVSFEVAGRPATFATAAERPWRAAVAEALDQALTDPAVARPAPGARFMLRIEFRTPVPATVNDAWDLDNLIKPTMDAMGAVFGYRQQQGRPQGDDEAVDRIEASKRTVRPHETTGANIEVHADRVVPGDQ